MHLSPNLFSFIVLMELVIALAQTNNTGALYFPAENEGNSQVYYNNDQQRVQSVPADLSSIRGTSLYEEYVNGIIATGITRLTVKLNRLLTNEGKTANVVFSPLSISNALALVLLGSNGVTFKEISEFMGLEAGIIDFNTKSQIVHEQFSRLVGKLIATNGFNLGEQLNVASAVFVQSGYPIRSLYKDTAEELYRSSIVNADFQRNPRSAQLQVNQWVEKNTNGKIKNILNELPSGDTKVIVASALYFNAEWENHFFAGSTRKRPFYINGRNFPSLHEIDMMSNGGDFPYYKDPELGCEILGFPYKGNRSTMYVIIPADSSKEKLHQFESKLTENDLKKLVSKTKMTGTVILFPKMKIEGTFDLKKSLEVLGVRSLFNPQQANLALLSPGEFEIRMNTATPATVGSNTVDNKILTSPQRNQSTIFNTSNNQMSKQIIFRNRVSFQAAPVVESRSTVTLDNIRQLLNQQSTDNHYQNPGLYADQVIHKVYMDITELGTEAAAATSVSLSRDGSRVTFRVDVPFIFFIMNEETKTILFWGSVVVPTPNYPTY